MDVELRASLAKEIRSILKHEKISAVMVTHDQHEAFSMADRIGVINEGRLLQWATAEDLYHSPANRFVARFGASIIAVTRKFSIRRGGKNHLNS